MWSITACTRASRDHVREQVVTVGVLSATAAFGFGLRACTHLQQTAREAAAFMTGPRADLANAPDRDHRAAPVHAAPEDTNGARDLRLAHPHPRASEVGEPLHCPLGCAQGGADRRRTDLAGGHMDGDDDVAHVCARVVHNVRLEPLARRPFRRERLLRTRTLAQTLRMV